MSANEIHVGDIGTIFEFTVKDGTAVVNISTATVKEAKFRKPDCSTITRTLAFKTNGADGIVKYTCLASDLDQPGEWKAQVRVVMPTGEWHSDWAEFSVYRNL